jgi:hypothetical protein
MGTSGGKSTVRLIEGDKQPTVWIYPTAYNLMSFWAELAGKQSYEFTCLGRCVQRDGELYVTDAYMVKHEGTSAHVDMDDGDQIQLMMKLADAGFDGVLVDTKVPVPPDEIRCWTHSHPGTGPQATFWSGTDDACIERFLTGPFCVAIVFDSAGMNPKCRIDLKEPRVQMTANLKLHVPWLSEEQEKEAKALFKAKSSKVGFSQKNPYPSQSRGGPGNYSHGSQYTGHGGYTGVYQPQTLKSVHSAPPAVKGVPDEVEVEQSDEQLTERIKALFGLDDDQVDPDWLDWAREHSDDYGEWTVGEEQDEEDSQVSLLDAEREVAGTVSGEEAMYDAYGDEALDAYDELVAGEGAQIIPLAEIKSLGEGGDTLDIISVTGDESVEDLSWIEDAEIREVGDYTTGIIGGRKVKLPPDSSMAERMKLAAIDEDLSHLAVSVVTKVLTLKQAVTTLCARHDISQAVATEKIEALLKG